MPVARGRRRLVLGPSCRAPTASARTRRIIPTRGISKALVGANRTAGMGRHCPPPPQSASSRARMPDAWTLFELFQMWTLTGRHSTASS